MRGEMTNASWFALKVRSRSEWLVAKKLLMKGYEVFNPTYVTRRKWSDRVISAELPLFPGYVFCRFDVQKRLPILVTSGVHLIVGRGKVPEPVPEEEIDAIRRIVESGGDYGPHAYVSVGTACRIVEGALSGLEGVAIRLKGHYRLIVSVHLLQRSVAVEVDQMSVEPIRRFGGN